MAIVIDLDVMLAMRKKKSKELSKYIGITEQNLSTLKTGKAKAVRMSTLNAICKFLECTPGDILKYKPDEELSEA
ncbi:MAG: helix-turn-helix transcriptional regulator [Gammaproteobacteria bacterium]|jgi:putative transcriptional regulator|nr:helix-turn-helix transcriptional regulator [Gammaproteobacteria bacterium]